MQIWCVIHFLHRNKYPSRVLRYFLSIHADSEANILSSVISVAISAADGGTPPHHSSTKNSESDVIANSRRQTENWQRLKLWMFYNKCPERFLRQNTSRTLGPEKKLIPRAGLLQLDFHLSVRNTEGKIQHLNQLHYCRSFRIFCKAWSRLFIFTLNAKDRKIEDIENQKLASSIMVSSGCCLTVNIFYLQLSVYLFRPYKLSA